MTTPRNNINVNSEAYNPGCEAAARGEWRSANPYCRGTVDAANWLAGWIDAAPRRQYGWLLRCSDASYIRPATARELRASVCAGDEGVIEVTIDGERVACYVEE